MASVIPKTNISMRAVRSTLFEGTRSLWGLCNSPKINKFCKFRPGRTEKNHILECFPVDVGSESVITELLDKKCSFMPITLTKGAKLSDFAGYDHNCVPPISVGLPDKLFKNRVNAFTLYPIESTLDKAQFGFSELYQTLAGGSWYTAVMLKKGDQYVLYVAERDTPNFVDIDLTNDNFIQQGDRVTALVAITDLPKSEIEVSRVFNSVWWESAENYTKRDYVVEFATLPDYYRASITVENGAINYDEVSWDMIELTLDATGLGGGTVNWEVWLETNEPLNGRRSLGYGSTLVPSGQQVKVSVTSFDIESFTRPFNVAFIEMRDKDRGGRVMASTSILR